MVAGPVCESAGRREHEWPDGLEPVGLHSEMTQSWDIGLARCRAAGAVDRTGYEKDAVGLALPRKLEEARTRWAGDIVTLDLAWRWLHGLRTRCLRCGKSRAESAFIMLRAFLSPWVVRDLSVVVDWKS